MLGCTADADNVAVHPRRVGLAEQRLGRQGICLILMNSRAGVGVVGIEDRHNNPLFLATARHVACGLNGNDQPWIESIDDVSLWKREEGMRLAQARSWATPAGADPGCPNVSQNGNTEPGRGDYSTIYINIKRDTTRKDAEGLGASGRAPTKWNGTRREGTPSLVPAPSHSRPDIFCRVKQPRQW